MDDRPTADDPQQPLTPGGWLRQNGVSLVVVAAALVAVFRYLHPWDVLLAVAGLSFIIFVHELGHFLAAKWCDVHVKTFSIGFGPAVPGCQFTYGETTYKLALIPLGGYVAMVGEGETGGDVSADPPDDPENKRESAHDPRSFANKPVAQRMLVISAGVVMNILLGATFFAVAYTHGVDEVPTVVSAVEPGSAAWRAGLRPGSEITRLNGRADPFYDDLRVAVTSTGKGETVDLLVRTEGQETPLVVEPLRQEGALYPTLGVIAPKRLTLPPARRGDREVARPGSPAAAAGFEPGDKLVAMSDPADPAKLTPFAATTAGRPGEYFDYLDRLQKLAGQPVTVRVARGDGEATVTVPPAFRKVFGGRMRMGAVTAVRTGSPAEKAGLRPRRADGDTVLEPGDEIVAVQLPGAGRYTADATELADPANKPLDPVRLPWELARWAATRPAGQPVTLTVLREADAATHTRQRAELKVDWDDRYRDDGGPLLNPGTPLTVGGLGLGYQVQAVVGAVADGSPAAAAGLQPNDRVQQVRFTYQAGDGEKQTKWEDVPAHQWAYVDHRLQAEPPHRFDARVERNGQVVELTLQAADDPTWPVVDRGLFLEDDRRPQKADGVVDALRLGAYRAVRSGKMIYQQLYAMVFGRISYKLISGPITLARASYIIAGQDVWHLLVWMALISINLAVVNFLPIPVLDGGHMVFLIYEGLRGKPAPPVVQAVLTYAGLAMVGGLMLFVIGLDVWRLVFA